MTFEERVQALEPLGFSGKQTRFLATVALHGGFCLRRQYTAFAGLRYGQGVRDFLDRLVTRRLAKRLAFRPDRGHVYHLSNSAIYHAIAQDDNRNRRHSSPALIARKLMLLDYVLGQPPGDWYATEQDKVALFTTRFGVRPAELPQRVYLARRRGDPHTTRYFIQKLPILVTADPTAVSFAFLVTDTTGEAFGQFLQDHLRLLNRLPTWRLIAVAPMHLPGLPGCAAALQRFCVALQRPRAAEEVGALQTYFTWREMFERDDCSFTAPDHNKVIKEWHAYRQRFATGEYQDLYDQWKTEGPPVLERRGGQPFLAALRDGRGELVTHRLPLRYDRFGTRAGVC
jgi:hypothetical protein